MIRAYDECYLPGAKRRLGFALQYAVDDCGVDPDAFARAFVGTGYARGFAEGDPWIVAGMSGVELARRVLRESGLATSLPDPNYAEARTPEHWAGFVMARYQWERAVSFDALFRQVLPSEIVGLYPMYHEMPETRLAEELDSRMEGDLRGDTSLGRIRRARGLSQTRLAELSSVGIRSIRAYEQRENDIRKAQGLALVRLSRVLGCTVEDLLDA